MGQCRLGCQRAFIYAKDFNCDKKIPIQYSFLYQNKYLTKLIEYYLEQEDDLDIDCYIIDEWGQLKTDTLFSLIEQKCFLDDNFYCNNPKIDDLLD